MMRERITSRKNPLLQHVRKLLTSRSYREKNGEYAADGVKLLADLGLPSYFYYMIPYVVVLIVLAFTSKKSRAPKAEGIPYDKGQR